MPTAIPHQCRRRVMPIARSYTNKSRHRHLNNDHDDAPSVALPTQCGPFQGEPGWVLPPPSSPPRGEVAAAHYRTVSPLHQSKPPGRVARSNCPGELSRRTSTHCLTTPASSVCSLATFTFALKPSARGLNCTHCCEGNAIPHFSASVAATGVWRPPCSRPALPLGRSA